MKNLNDKQIPIMLGREGDNALADRSKIIVEHQVVNGIHLHILFVEMIEIFSFTKLRTKSQKCVWIETTDHRFFVETFLVLDLSKESTHFFQDLKSVHDKELSMNVYQICFEWSLYVLELSLAFKPFHKKIKCVWVFVIPYALLKK